MKKLPKELEEAAAIDGAGTFRTFRQIILPNAYPAPRRARDPAIPGVMERVPVAAHRVALAGTPDAPAGLASFQGLFGVNWNWVLAGAMFNAVPIVILVIFFQKYFIRSAASSAVKG